MSLVFSRVFDVVKTLHRRHPHAAAAFFFMIMQALIVIALLGEMATKNYIFWYCNNIAFFIAIALWEGRVQVAKALNYVGLLPQILWMSDFLSHLVGFDLSNTANYVFVAGFTFSSGVAVIIHFAVPIVVYVYTVRFRPEPHALTYSLLYIVGLYVVTLLGTNPAEDMNCVFNACAETVRAVHLPLWPLYMTILTIGGFALHEYGYRLLHAWNGRRALPTASL